MSKRGDVLSGGNEAAIRKGIFEESEMEDAYFYSINSMSSEPPPSLLPFLRGKVLDVMNISEYTSLNGFSPYSSAWQTTTNDPMSTVEAETGKTWSDSGDGANHDDSSLPLPLNFTEISQLNKDCIIVYAILFVLAAIGNILVLYCVSRYDRLGKSRTPLLIMNLCIADLIVTFFLMPTEIFWRFTIAWKGGDVLCKFFQFVRAFGMYLSSNVVICISIDRYFAIVYPLKLAGAVRRVKWMLVAAWIVSAVFAGPQMFVYHVASHPEYPEFRQCVTKAFLTTGRYNELIYNVSSVSALYFIPLLVIIYTYTMILWKIHQKSREHRVANSQPETVEGESNHSRTSRASGNYLSIPQPQSEMIAIRPTENANNFNRSASKRTRLMLRSTANQTATLTRARSRTLRLTLLILLTFIFCWTPYVTMTLWYMLDRGGASQVDERLQEALFIMAVTNSVLNPLIYGTVGRRQDFKKRFNALVRSSAWTHGFLKHTLCCGRVYELCCEQNDRRNSETVVITLNRTHGGSSRRSRVETGNCSGSSYPHAPSPSSYHQESDISPRSQIVALRSSSNVQNNTSIVSRFVRSLTNYNGRSRRNGNTLELSCTRRRDKNECIECGSMDTTQYIVTPGQSFASQTCTQL